MAKEKKSRKSGNNTGIALAIWIVIALALFILFIINWEKIVGNLKETGFFGKVFGKTPTYVEQFETPKKVEESENDVAPLPSSGVIIDLNGKANAADGGDNSLVDPASKSDNGSGKDGTGNGALSSAGGATEGSAAGTSGSNGAASASGSGSSSSASTGSSSASTGGASSTSASSSSGSGSGSTSKISSDSKSESKNNTAAASTPKVEAPKTMNIKLYFMTVKADGSVVRKEVVRAMKKSDSPLVDSINALIAGPNHSEEDSGCRTLVSSGTKLLSASIRNGVATLNFNGAFERNEVGIEGLRGQLEQIVFTATAFPTVDSVQFLLDGEKKQFLGEEGVWIGTPLNRNSF